MNTIYTEINEVRRKLKALELKIFIEGANADMDSTVIEDIEDAMKCLANIEAKVKDAPLLILKTGECSHE